VKIHCRFVFAFTLLPSLACSSSSSPSGAAAGGERDAAAPLDASFDAAIDAAPAPVPEPPWSGTTIEPGCTVNGCIHAFAEKTTYSKALLAANAAPGNAVLNGIIEYGITYVSSGAEITGTVFFPDSTPPAGGFGVVVMNQFTSGVGASCAPSVGELAIGVASASALNGFVTIVPDATSYGTPPYGAYIEGPIAGKAALDAARAAFHTTQASGMPIARKAVIAGLSQGAYSTMAAATAYPTYANELEIRGFAAAEPPSNLRGTTNRALTSGPPPVVYDAMRLWSWQGLRGLSGGPIFLAPYDTLAPTWFDNDCVFNGSDGSDGTLFNDFYFPEDDGGLSTTEEDGGQNTAPIPTASLVTPTFLGYAQNDSWPADWAAEYAACETVPSYLTLPVLIFEGSADTVVLPSDTNAYVAQLQAAGVNVTYDQIPGGTHGTTALSSFTVTQLANDQAIAWITSTLAN
jgi:pimeloyl-ACP methyl ester carboxylesterase